MLDIGSNSAQLQVFEVRPGAPPLPTHAVKEPTLLGEAFHPDGAIDQDGTDRVITAVNHAMSAARRLGVRQLYVFTTSAVRDATNRDHILDRVEAGAGVRPQFLSGVDEGRLTRKFLPDDPPSTYRCARCPASRTRKAGRACTSAAGARSSPRPPRPVADRGAPARVVSGQPGIGRPVSAVPAGRRPR